MSGGDADAVQQTLDWIRIALSRYRRELGAELEDLEQEVLLAILHAIERDRLRGESSPSTFCQSIAHHKAIDLVRRQRVRTNKRDLLSEIFDESPEIEQASESFLRVSRADDRRLAAAVFAEMGEECRRLWAAILDGQSYKEMSADYGVSPGTLRVRVRRCRERAAKLRRSIEKNL